MEIDFNSKEFSRNKFGKQVNAKREINTKDFSKSKMKGLLKDNVIQIGICILIFLAVFGIISIFFFLFYKLNLSCYNN
jgi:hypothetical protein